MEYYNRKTKAYGTKPAPLTDIVDAIKEIVGEKTFFELTEKGLEVGKNLTVQEKADLKTLLDSRA